VLSNHALSGLPDADATPVLLGEATPSARRSLAGSEFDGPGCVVCAALDAVPGVPAACAVGVVDVDCDATAALSPAGKVLLEPSCCASRNIRSLATSGALVDGVAGAATGAEMAAGALAAVTTVWPAAMTLVAAQRTSAPTHASKRALREHERNSEENPMKG
jgi:hypothetical protein